MAAPDTVFVGCWTKTSLVAAPGVTVMALDTPVIVLVTVSVAVTVAVPAVLGVTENVPLPLVRVASAGKTAAASVLVKCAIPL